MTLRPANLDDLRSSVAKANATDGRVTSVDLGALANIREHTPEDMTVTVEAGMTVAALQGELGRVGQWLPIDPPNPERVTVGELLSENLSGPRRFGYGTIREHLIGIGVVLADGRLIHAGGKVVKNVAGYDLCKLFVGARGTLGVIVEATFKLRPLPESEVFVQMECASLDEAARRIESVLDSPLTPVVLDLHNRTACGLQAASALADERELERPSGRAPVAVVLGFAGTRAEVDWQLARAAELGFNSDANHEYHRAFWSGTGVVRKLSTAPSKLIEALMDLGGKPFVARAGNGVIYYRGGPQPAREHLPNELFRRLKHAYDPKKIFPDLTL